MMYINVNWPVALYGGPGVWIDEAPGNFITDNYGAEHNFRLTPTGTSVLVYVDGNPSIATITTSGWYNFQMTFQQEAPCNDGSVTTNTNVFDASGNLIGTTVVCGDSPDGPQLATDLAGPGYVWITVWPNGWAGDVLGIDNVRVDRYKPQRRLRSGGRFAKTACPPAYNSAAGENRKKKTVMRTPKIA